MTDRIERVISESGKLFGVACNTTGLVSEACKRHDVGPLAAAALGRALTGAALLSALMKDNQSLLLKFEGNGPLKKLLAEAGYDGWTRGYIAAPHAHLPLANGQIDVVNGIGQAGLLTVTKKIGNGKTYPGTINLYKSTIADDLAYYLSQSEQTPSTIGLTVHLLPDGTVAAAGGFLIQSLPPADEKILTALEQQIATLPPLSDLLQNDAPADVLSRIFQEIPHKTIHSKALRYQCSCSLEKMKNALLSLGAQGIEDLMISQGGAEVHCEFCRKTYEFNKNDLQNLLQKIQ